MGKKGGVRRCQVCGKKLKRRSGEQSGCWKKRVTCGHEAGCGHHLGGLKRRTLRDPGHRFCEVCQKPLTKRPHEPRYAFLKRKTCGRDSECMGGWAIKHSLPGPRWCQAPGCGKKLVRGNREGRAEFVKRRTCRRPADCANVLGGSNNRRRLPERRCIVCETQLTRRNGASGRLESAVEFIKRKTCGKNTACYGASRLRGKDPGPRICSNKACGRELEIRKGEDWNSFLKRLSCGPSCSKTKTWSIDGIHLSTKELAYLAGVKVVTMTARLGRHHLTPLQAIQLGNV